MQQALHSPLRGGCMVCLVGEFRVFGLDKSFWGAGFRDLDLGSKDSRLGFRGVGIRL